MTTTGYIVLGIVVLISVLYSFISKEDKKEEMPLTVEERHIKDALFYVKIHRVITIEQLSTLMDINYTTASSILTKMYNKKYVSISTQTELTTYHYINPEKLEYYDKPRTNINSFSRN